MASQRLSQAKQRLDFKDKLVQSGKKETSDALLKRLQTLHGKLKALEQDYTDVDSLESVRKPLISNVILHHKDRGVKAYAACCLADILRLTAPDAPYTANELRDIFQFFSVQIRNLRTSPIRPLQPSRTKTNDASQSQTQSQGAASQRITDAAYYTEYCYLIESLATIKSVVLVCDVPTGEALIEDYFLAFREIVRPDMSKGLIRHFVTILALLVEESASISSEIMDTIFAEFENIAKTKTISTAAQMIVDVCNMTSDRLQRPVLAHFSDIQLKHGKNSSTEDQKILQESHELILTVYRRAPGLLLNVVPVLEENLRAADEVFLRQISTKTLGTMFGERPVVGSGTADLARAYPAVWRSWIGRRLDKNVNVRLAWVEASKIILSNHPELRLELEPYLVDRIQDSQDPVRAVICKVICSLEYETALHHISEETLRAVGGRMSDKKSNVRSAAANGLARLWSAAYSEIEANEDDAIVQFGWIPEAMFHCLQKEISVEMKIQMTSIVKERILPLPEKAEDEQAWVDRLMLVATHIDETAFKALEKTTGLIGYARGASPYRAFIDICEANNGGVIDNAQDEQVIRHRLSFIINAMSKQLFAEPEAAKRDMERFASANDPRLYKLFKKCADPESDLRELIKAKNELLRRIEQMHSDTLETFTILVQNASFNIINTSSISPLLKILSRPGTGEARITRINAASRLLSLMAKECAPMYRSHEAELGVVMSDKKAEKLAEVALQALAQLAKIDRSASGAETEQRYVDKAMKMAQEGTPRQGKFAARFIAYQSDPELSKKLVKTVAQSLPKSSGERLLTNLRVLAEVALSAPEALEERSGEIHDFVMKKVIRKHLASAKDADTDEWTEEKDLPTEDQAKLLSLRLVTYRALGFGRTANAVEIAQPVLDLLEKLILDEGSTSETDDSAEGQATRAQLRLRAALCALKMANVKKYDKIMGGIYEKIAWLLQDPLYEVRFHLLLKLAKILPAQRLLARWNILPAMVALDPSKENVHMGKSIILSTVKACSQFPVQEKIDRIEMPLARLLWFLASGTGNDGNDTQMEIDEEGEAAPIESGEWSLAALKDYARYIEVYLDCVAGRENIGLLYHIAGKVKSVKSVLREGEVEEYEPDQDGQRGRPILRPRDRRLFKFSELAQIILKNRSETNHWNITTYPGSVKFPRDIFHNVQSVSEIHEHTRQTFLTNQEINWAKNLGRKVIAVAGPSRRPHETNGSPTKAEKRSRATTTRKVSRKKARKSAQADSESELSEDDDDEIEDDEVESEEGQDEDEQEEEKGEAVVGRGGKRGAKTKAKKGMKKKPQKVRKDDPTLEKTSARKSEEDGSSELSELDGDDD